MTNQAATHQAADQFSACPTLDHARTFVYQLRCVGHGTWAMADAAAVMFRTLSPYCPQSPWYTIGGEEDLCRRARGAAAMVVDAAIS
jgi:hypothetical protein